MGAGVCLFLSLGLAAFAPQLEVDNSTESFLREGDPARQRYDAFREQFGQDEQLRIAIRPAEVFDLAFLERLRALHEDIEREVPYVDEVTSLWNARNTRGEGDRLVVEDLMEDWPETEAEVAALRERVLATPTYRNTLVNAEGTVTTIVIEPFIYSTLGPADESLEGFEDVVAAEEPEFLTGAENLEMVAALREVVGRYAGSDFETYMAGGSIMDQVLAEGLARDVGIFMTLGVLFMLVLLFALFRRASAMLLPVMLVLLSIAANFGLMALLGIPTSVSGQVLPVLVLVVGISGAIHILTIVYKRMGEGATREDAIVGALAHSGLAVFMAAATTAAGLVSFSLAHMAQISNLGRAAPIGVMLTFVYSVTLLPALLAILPLRASRHGGDVVQRRLARGLAHVGDLATARPRRVLIIAAAIAAAAGFGVAELRFSHDGMRWFPEEDPSRIALEFLDSELGGGGGSRSGWIRGGRTGFTTPTSCAAWTKPSSSRAHSKRAAERALLAEELLLLENSGAEHLEDFVDPQLSMASLSVRATYVDGNLYVPFMERLEAGLREILGDGVDVTITGIGALMGRTFRILDITMAQSYAIALVVITPLMVLLIGNLGRGLLSMIPNLLPIWLTLGFMGLLGIPLDSSTLLLGCVVIGLAVDDTIHFMHKFQRYLALRGDARWAVRETLETTGAALFFTTLVITAGFSTMLFGYMNDSREFGLLAGFAAVTAFPADLLVVPALMALATRHRTTVEGPVGAPAAGERV